MRRLVVSALLGALASVGVASSATAAGASTACTITDHRLIGLSGLIVTPTGYIGISDSNFDKTKIRIWYVDRHCKFVKSVGYPTSAYDPEDVAVGHDGTLYVADTGDNGLTRKSIAVWRLKPGSTTPKIYRYAYPDGPHDNEAILLAADDTPIFVTKDPLVAHVYVPAAPADPSGKPVPLKDAGTVTVHLSDTPNGLGELGSGVIDGGAQTPDRRKVALRTYADAYEWPVPDGDVVKAITGTEPVITPLTGEPFGESIAYSSDGKFLYTVSDLETDPVRTKILRYPSALVPGAPVTPTGASASGTAGAGSAGGAASPGRHGATAVADKSASYRNIGVLAAVGLALIAAGVIGVILSRRRASQ